MTAPTLPMALRGLRQFGSSPVRMWTGEARYKAIAGLHRDGFLSVKPVSRDSVDVALTQKGRDALDGKLPDGGVA